MTEKSYDSVKDSGNRRDFGTGSVRDRAAGKGQPVMIPTYALRRLAKHYENGAEKYGLYNWMLGQPLREYLNSAYRHLWCVAEGMDDEDHLAAALWNVIGFMMTQKWIDEGQLPKSLDNLVITVEDARREQEAYNGNRITLPAGIPSN